MKKNQDSTFSIITVTRNNLGGLRRTCDSICIQNCTDYEWVVIDGASTDGTPEYLKALKTGTFISEPDTGIYDAMNKGMKLSKGKYLLFLNAGDLFTHENVLSDLLPLTVESPDFIYGDSLEPEKNGKPPFYKAARPHQKILWGMFTHHQAMVYSRAHAIKHNLRYHVIYPIAGDYDFTIRFLQKCENVKYLPKPICIFEAGGLSQQNAFEGRREQYIIREQLDTLAQPENLGIFLAQTVVWYLRRFCPALYRLLKKIKI